MYIYPKASRAASRTDDFICLVSIVRWDVVISYYFVRRSVSFNGDVPPSVAFRVYGLYSRQGIYPNNDTFIIVSLRHSALLVPRIDERQQAMQPIPSVAVHFVPVQFQAVLRYPVILPCHVFSRFYMPTFHYS